MADKPHLYATFLFNPSNHRVVTLSLDPAPTALFVNEKETGFAFSLTEMGVNDNFFLNLFDGASDVEHCLEEFLGYFVFMIMNEGYYHPARFLFEQSVEEGAQADGLFLHILNKDDIQHLAISAHAHPAYNRYAKDHGYLYADKPALAHMIYKAKDGVSRFYFDDRCNMIMSFILQRQRRNTDTAYFQSFLTKFATTFSEMYSEYVCQHGRDDRK